MPQQQVLEHEVVTWASPRKNGREEKPEEFEHIISIADPPSREVVPPHNPIVQGVLVSIAHTLMRDRSVYLELRLQSS